MKGEGEYCIQLTFAEQFFVHFSVIHSCLTLCNSMDWSMPGFPVLHYFLEFAQTHVHWEQWSHSAVNAFSFQVIADLNFLISFHSHNGEWKIRNDKVEWPNSYYLQVTPDWFQIGKGVSQGCILSPCLYNFYAEYTMRNAGLEEAQAGIKIARRNINNLRKS